MSEPPPSHGALPIPPEVLSEDARQAEEDAAVADVEARLQAGRIDGERADQELLEIALARLHYLDDEQRRELRDFGRLLLEEPEMVYSREPVSTDPEPPVEMPDGARPTWPDGGPANRGPANGGTPTSGGPANGGSSP